MNSSRCSTVNSSQIEFIDVIINHLTEHGFMNPELLYESPFIDFSPRGPDGIFASTQVDGLISALRGIRKTAVV
jgi:type I restriction enzyme, R subunit